MANQFTRRSLLAMGVAIVNGCIAMLMAVPAVAFLLTPLRRKRESGWVRLGPVSQWTGDRPQRVQYRTHNDAEFIDNAQRKLAFVMRDQDGWRVLSARCTHMGCTVAYHPDTDTFDCPCHGGRYNRQGNVISGPPPQPLQQFNARVVDDNLEVEVS